MGGYKSFLAFWMGGAAAPATEPSIVFISFLGI